MSQKMSRRDSGRLGGSRTRDLYGKPHFQQIGVRGGNELKRRHSPEYFVQLGKMGGWPRKNKGTGGPAKTLQTEKEGVPVATADVAPFAWTVKGGNENAKVNQVTIAFRDAEADAFRALVAHADMSNADFVREAIGAYLREKKAACAPPPPSSR